MEDIGNWFSRGGKQQIGAEIDGMNCGMEGE
jgi:hypothetical protein